MEEIKNDLFDTLIEEAVKDRCEKEDLLQVWSDDEQKKRKIRKIFFSVSGIAACLVCIATIISVWENQNVPKSGLYEIDNDNAMVPMQPSVSLSITIDSMILDTEKDSINSVTSFEDNN